METWILGTVAHEPQCGHVRQEMGICKLELFRFSYVCVYVFDILLRVGKELDISPFWDGGEAD